MITPALFLQRYLRASSSSNFVLHNPKIQNTKAPVINTRSYSPHQLLREHTFIRSDLQKINSTGNIFPA